MDMSLQCNSRCNNVYTVKQTTRFWFKSIKKYKLRCNTLETILTEMSLDAGWMEDARTTGDGDTKILVRRDASNSGQCMVNMQQLDVSFLCRQN